jgi:hypothetical protein
MAEHNFLSQSYGFTPTQCFVCSEFLNGFWQDCYQCTNCAINVHEACKPPQTQTCFVTHRFIATSFANLSLCAACGEPMIGLFNQGFQCEDCLLNVHSTCRTQSSISQCKKALNRKSTVAPPRMTQHLTTLHSLYSQDEPRGQMSTRTVSSRSGGLPRLMTHTQSNMYEVAQAQAAKDLPLEFERIANEMKNKKNVNY